jgi:hypothetical protein
LVLLLFAFIGPWVHRSVVGRPAVLLARRSRQVPSDDDASASLDDAGPQATDDRNDRNDRNDGTNQVVDLTASAQGADDDVAAMTTSVVKPTATTTKEQR